MIPWYYWDFSFLKENGQKDEYKKAYICILNGVLLMRAYFNASVDSKAAFVGYTMKDDVYSSADQVFFNDYISDQLQIKDSVIFSSLATKLFELGNGIYNINVDNVYVKTGSNNSADIIVKFMSDQGEEVTVVKENRKFTTLTATNFIKPKLIRPCMRAVLKFGLQIECDGQLAIDGVAIKYRLLGGAK